MKMSPTSLKFNTKKSLVLSRAVFPIVCSLAAAKSLHPLFIPEETPNPKLKSSIQKLILKMFLFLILWCLSSCSEAFLGRLIRKGKKISYCRQSSKKESFSRTWFSSALLINRVLYWSTEWVLYWSTERSIDV